MKRNMGTVDRLLRAFVIMPVLIVLGFVFGAGTVLGVVAFVLADVMLVTSATGFCPAYTPFGSSTRGGISTHGRARLVALGSWHSTSEQPRLVAHGSERRCDGW